MPSAVHIVVSDRGWILERLAKAGVEPSVGSVGDSGACPRAGKAGPGGQCPRRNHQRPLQSRGDPSGDRREIGGATAVEYFRARSLTEGGYVAWVLRLVEIGAEGEGSCADVVEISRPDGLVDIADLGLTLAEAKLVLAGVQREIVAAQARDHAVRRPGCRYCEGVCRVKDYRQHAIATLFGQVAVRLPRFRCAGCGTTGTGVKWPPYARSTPELDRLRAQLSALLTYRTAAALLGQMFPVDAGQDPETLRRHTFKIAKTLSMTSAAEAPVSVDAGAIIVTLDSTFIRSCEDGERHLEVRIGNVETESGGRQVFGAVAKANTDIGALIRYALDAVGRTGDTGDRRKVGGQAATAIGGCGSLIGRNFCPKPVPSVPL